MRQRCTEAVVSVQDSDEFSGLQEGEQPIALRLLYECEALSCTFCHYLQRYDRLLGSIKQSTVRWSEMSLISSLVNQQNIGSSLTRWIAELRNLLEPFSVHKYFGVNLLAIDCFVQDKLSLNFAKWDTEFIKAQKLDQTTLDESLSTLLLDSNQTSLILGLTRDDQDSLFDQFKVCTLLTVVDGCNCSRNCWRDAPKN